jgi:hypothetical protein
MEPAGTDKDDWSFDTGLPRELMSVNHPEPKIPDVIANRNGINLSVVWFGRYDNAFSRGGDWQKIYELSFGIKHWFLAILLSLLPVMRVWHMTRECKRRQAIGGGRCTVCGYDLRASDERCPECGKPMEVAAVKVAS